MKRLGLLLIVSLIGAPTAGAAEYYAAPDASAGGNGSKARPWGLETALALAQAIKPGDTVWVRGGTYRGTFASELTGSPSQPILVRQYPGERATLDCSTSTLPALTINGAWAWYWGLEVCSSWPDRSRPRAAGLSIYGPNTKCINLVVHDAGVGIGSWSTATNSEICGCLVYFNGWQGGLTDRGHGHAIYAQNAAGTKLFRDNILFDQFGFGVHVYTESGAIQGFELEGNAAFDNGLLTRQATRSDNYLIGGLKPAAAIVLRQNFGYHTPGKGGANLALGYQPIRLLQALYGNADALVQSNYLAGGGLLCKYWTNLTVRGNTFALLTGSVALDPGPGALPCHWDDNQYFLTTSTPFNFAGSALSFAEWKTRTGYDAASRLAASPPPTPQVFVRPNPYETNRANLIVFNWGRQETVPADLAGVLAPGVNIEVRNAQDFFGPPVWSGRYTGRPIQLPMTHLTIAQPVGAEGRARAPGPDFNVFVVLPAQR